MNVGFWTLALWVTTSHGANILRMDIQFGNDLTKGLANDSWFLKFPGSIVQHLQCISSDHCPLLINLLGLDPLPQKKNFQV